MTLEKSAASRAWQHVDGASDEVKKDNPYLNPASHTLKKLSPIDALFTPDGCIMMNDIKCYDSNGKVTEEYPALYVRTDVFRYKEIYYDDTRIQKHLPSSIYTGIVDCNNKGLFLPSAALSCAILVWLYEHRNDDPVIKEILYQYKDYGFGVGLHVQNTIIDKKTKEVIHYPSHFPTMATGDRVNSGNVEIRRRFTSNPPYIVSLEAALNEKNKLSSIQNLTGLQDPIILLEISAEFGVNAAYFDRITKDISAVSLGATLFFQIDASVRMDEATLAARGVHSKRDGAK